MNEFSRNVTVLVFLILLISSGIVSCSSGNKSKRSEESTINGTVEQLIFTKTTEKKKNSIFSSLKNLFRLTKIANAQVPGILVIARQDGLEVDRDVSNSLGEFNLTVPTGGIVSLEFIVSGANPFSTITEINITPNSIVILVVNLFPNLIPPRPPAVKVVTFEIVSDPIRCKEFEEFQFVNPEVMLFTVNGDGKNCIEISDFCDLDIRVGGSLTLEDCINGLLISDSGDGLLESDSPATLSIFANNNGVDTSGESGATLIGNGITIFAGKAGILAREFSTVILEPIPPTNCTISGGEIAVDRQDAATVETAGCALAP